MSHKRSIYLAGKIAKNDWRHDVCEGLTAACSDQGYAIAVGDEDAIDWSKYRVEVLGTWSYTGPFFSGCDHGCGHSGRGHGVSGGCIDWEHGSMIRPWVNKQCLDAIARTDIFFAWLDDPTAYGTLVEIGYAKALGKKVVVAYDSLAGWTPELGELWFAHETATSIIIAHDAAAALMKLAEQEQIRAEDERLRRSPVESPIERIFWDAYIRVHRSLTALQGLTTQHLVGRYRVDFAIPDRKIAIELDGYAYHTTRQQFTRDRIRQRELEQQGWRLIRFSGAEVKADPAGCVRQAAEFVQSINGHHPDSGAA